MKRSRATYIYRIAEAKGLKLLLIVDEDQGMSVTNDIENVVYDISVNENINPAHYYIFYRDTMGFWDGWDYHTGQFFVFRATSYEEVVDKLDGIKYGRLTPIEQQKKIGN